MKLVLATTNKGKLAELKRLLPELEILSLEDINFTEVIEEPFETFEENAAEKAKTIFNFCGLPTLADDSGLCVNALNGAPGVHSAYYGGEQGNSEKNIERLLRELAGISNREAHFTSILCLATEKGIQFFEGTCAGSIAAKKSGEAGFGYDPIFIPKGFTKSFAEISIDEKNQISHRGKALQKLRQAIKRNEI